MGARTDRRHAQGDESRERILDATIEIASLRGYHGTSIAAVSERSGLPASSIYWHFKNKDDLVTAVIRRSFDAWSQSARRVGLERPDLDSGDRLRASMHGHAVALMKNPEFLRLGLMLALEQHPSEPTARVVFLQVRADTLAILEDVFTRLTKELRGAPDATLAHRVAVMALAAADGLFIAHQIDPNAFGLGDEFDLLADMFLRVLAS